MSTKPLKQLSYCTNVVPFNNLKSYSTEILKIYEAINALKLENFEHGLGLWLPNHAIELGSSTIQELSLLKHFNLFTLNGFPYSNFHQEIVKSDVYLPDLNSDKRLVYLKKLAQFATQFTTKDIVSISTLPIGYNSLSEINETTFCNVIILTTYLHQLFLDTGVVVQIGLELEPDGLLQKTEQAKQLFEILYNKCKLSKNYIGVCVDACHLAVNFETPNEIVRNLKDILICKVQLSSAIKTKDIDVFKEFCEPKYLHQTRFKPESTAQAFRIKEYSDLNLALDEVALSDETWTNGEWRSHFHVPVFWRGNEYIKSTQNELIEILKLFIDNSAPLKCDHFEVETYTYDVLPNELKINLIEQIIRELRFVDEIASKLLVDNSTLNEVYV